MGGVESIVVDEDVPPEVETPLVTGSANFEEDWTIVKTDMANAESCTFMDDYETECESLVTELTHMEEEFIEEDDKSEGTVENAIPEEQCEESMDEGEETSDTIPLSLTDLPSNVLSVINDHVELQDVLKTLPQTCHIAHEDIFRAGIESTDDNLKQVLLTMLLARADLPLLQALQPSIEQIVSASDESSDTVKDTAIHIKARYMELTANESEYGAETVNPLFDPALESNATQENELVEEQVKPMTELQLVLDSEYLAKNPMYKLQACRQDSKGNLEEIGEIDDEGDIVIGHEDDLPEQEILEGDITESDVETDVEGVDESSSEDSSEESEVEGCESDTDGVSPEEYVSLRQAELASANNFVDNDVSTSTESISLSETQQIINESAIEEMMNTGLSSDNPLFEGDITDSESLGEDAAVQIERVEEPDKEKSDLEEESERRTRNPSL